MKPYFKHDGITIYHADCREVASGTDRIGGSRVRCASYRQFWAPHSAVSSCLDHHILHYADSEDAILSDANRR